MRVAILGCGALGGVLAVRFSRRADVDLTVINRNPAIAGAADRVGLVLREGRRVTTARPRVVARLPEGTAPFDLVVLATKWDGLPAAARGLLPHLAPGGVFVTLQNGLIALDLARELGPDRVVPSCVLWGASMTAPGEYDLTAKGTTFLGVAAGDDAPARRAAAILGLATPVTLTRRIEGILWSKLAITASLTSLGAIAGLRFGPLAAHREGRRLIMGVGREVAAVAAARGTALAPLGPVFPVPWLTAPVRVHGPLRHLLVMLLGVKHRRTESGMSASLRTGRPTLVEHVNGRVVTLAADTGTPVPLNRAILGMLREMDAGRQAPRLSALGELAAAARRGPVPTGSPGTASSRGRASSSPASPRRRAR